MCVRVEGERPVGRKGGPQGGRKGGRGGGGRVQREAVVKRTWTAGLTVAGPGATA